MQIFILVVVFIIALLIAGRVILSKRDKKKEEPKPQKSREELANEEFQSRIIDLANKNIKKEIFATVFWYKENVDKFINYTMREYNIPREQISVEELLAFTKVGVVWEY